MDNHQVKDQDFFGIYGGLISIKNLSLIYWTKLLGTKVVWATFDPHWLEWDDQCGTYVAWLPHLNS